MFKWAGPNKLGRKLVSILTTNEQLGDSKANPCWPRHANNPGIRKDMNIIKAKRKTALFVVMPPIFFGSVDKQIFFFFFN